VEVTDAKPEPVTMPTVIPVIPQKDAAEDQLEGDIQHSNDPSKRTQAEVAKDEKTASVVKTLHNAYRMLRKQFLIDVNAGSISSLARLDDLCKDVYTVAPSLRKAIRKDRFMIKRLVDKADDKAAAIRHFFNAKRPSVLRELANNTEAA